MLFKKPTAKQCTVFTSATKSEVSAKEAQDKARREAASIIGASLGLEVSKDAVKPEDQRVMSADEKAVVEKAREFFEPLYSGTEGGFAFWWSRVLNTLLGVRAVAYAKRGAQTAPKGDKAPGPVEVTVHEMTPKEVLSDFFDEPLVNEIQWLAEQDDPKFAAQVREFIHSLHATKQGKKKFG